MGFVQVELDADTHRKLRAYADLALGDGKNQRMTVKKFAAELIKLEIARLEHESEETQVRQLVEQGRVTLVSKPAKQH